MTSTPHQMPAAEFAALASGEGQPTAARHLVAAQLSKHRILLAGVVKEVRRAGHPDHELVEAGQELLNRVEAAAPEAARTVLSYPALGAWALHTIRALRSDQAIPTARPGELAAIAAAAAVRARLDAEIEVPVTDGTVQLPSLGAAEEAGDTAVLRTRPLRLRSAGQWRALRPGVPGWAEIRTARTAGLHALIDDLHPFRMPADDGMPTGRLSPAEAAEYTGMLGAAWTVLDPASQAEITAIVRTIIPYQAPDSGHVSSSSPQVFGAVAMSRMPDQYTCAETLVHETQHLKLCALLDLVPLTADDDGRRYYAPWRPDPRPASGLLQGVYAFLGVTGFWRGQRTAAADSSVRTRAEAEFARWRESTGLAADTLLDSGQLTAHGKTFVTDIALVLEAWRREPVSAAALTVARQKAAAHRAGWAAANQ